jgi:hypothetical protein
MLSRSQVGPTPKPLAGLRQREQLLAMMVDKKVTREGQRKLIVSLEARN